MGQPPHWLLPARQMDADSLVRPYRRSPLLGCALRHAGNIIRPAGGLSGSRSLQRMERIGLDQPNSTWLCSASVVNIRLFLTYPTMRRDLMMSIEFKGRHFE